MGRSLACVIVFTGIWQVGCASLAEIRDFAALSKRAAEYFPFIMADMKASFIRQREMQNLDSGMDLKEATKKAEEDCAAHQLCKSVGDFAKAGKVLESYMKTLGQLAADNLTSFDESLKAFSSELRTSAGLGEPQRKAVQSLSTFLAGAAANGYRQRQLAKTLTSTDEDIGILTQGLADIVEIYKKQLDAEEIAMRGYFEGTIAEKGAQEPLARILVYDRYSRGREELKNKQSAADCYKEFLATIRKAHSELAQKSAKLDATQSRQLAVSYMASIDGQIQVVRKAF